MQFYKTAQVMRLSGLVGLNAAQAKIRKGRLTAVEDQPGVYDIPVGAALDFKAGELVGLEEMPKALRRQFVGGDSGGTPVPHDPKTGEPIAAAETGGQQSDGGGEPKPTANATGNGNGKGKRNRKSAAETGGQ